MEQETDPAGKLYLNEALILGPYQAVMVFPKLLLLDMGFHNHHRLAATTKLLPQHHF